MLGEIFDPKADLLVTESLRPHWSQAGAIVFVTFRTRDSIPREVVQRWDREKNEWMRCRGHTTDEHWREMAAKLDEQERAEFSQQFQRCREEFLDTCHGRCLLRRPELATIVADSLLHFDHQRYRLGDFVVMPNHVHLLSAFATPEAMYKQFESWLHFTAVRINKELGEHGHFWQQEPFDHLVRSVEQYEYLRKYIVDNPKKAKLKESEYIYRRRDG
jgi:putative transposase